MRLLQLPLLSGVLATSEQIFLQNPPEESIQVSELRLPPAILKSANCTSEENPNGTGCIRQDVGSFQAGDFTPDGNLIIVNVEFVGAPAAPDPASIYTGEQLILVKTDGGYFNNGDSWKCLTCSVPKANAIGLNPQRDYPHVFRSGLKALWGHNILDCGGELLESDGCTAEKTHIYPIYWNSREDGSGSGPRELRLHPDDVHMGWSSFTTDGGQFAFFGRLEFNENSSSGEALVPRYDLVDVNILVDPNDRSFIEVNGTELHLNPDVIMVGELRGFTGTGDEILYIGPPRESNNIDLFAVHIISGKVRRVTSHPEYADPIACSSDNEWFVVMDTRGSDRQMWMSGMRGIPPLIDLVTVTVAASTRNNGPRRFFQPYLVDKMGDRDGYYGQLVNAAGDGSKGSVNDPNWNGRADPAFSPDGTRIVYWQSLVVSPSCGGDNPLPCPVSTAQGGREYRLMLAHLSDREPVDLKPVFLPPDVIPWARPFQPGNTPMPHSLQSGNYTLQGKVSGLSHVQISASSSGFLSISSVAVTYENYSDDGLHTLNGFENATIDRPADNPWMNNVHWYSDIRQTGVVEGTKKTSHGGFYISIDAMANIFNANGTLTTTLDEKEYVQPQNGT